MATNVTIATNNASTNYTLSTGARGPAGSNAVTSADIVDASASGSPAVAGKAVLFGSQGQLEADYFRSKQSSQYPVADYEADQIVFYPDEFSGGEILSFPSGSGTLMLGSNNLSDLSNAGTARTNLKVPASDPTGVTGADAIVNIISLTQAEYDAIATPSATTLYIIV